MSGADLRIGPVRDTSARPSAMVCYHSRISLRIHHHRSGPVLISGLRRGTDAAIAQVPLSAFACCLYHLLQSKRLYPFVD